MKQRLYIGFLLSIVSLSKANQELQDWKHTQMIESWDSSETMVLANGMASSAILTSNNEIICTAIGLYSQYPAIATKIDSAGNLLWDSIWLGTPQESQDMNSNSKILPRSDGGAYFAFEYYEYMSSQDNTDFYAAYPHLQYIDAKGNIRWGETGVRLTSSKVDFQGGAEIKHISYCEDGNIMVYWTWFNDHGTPGQQQEFGTYIQKVDSENGDLLLGDSSKKLFDYRENVVENSFGDIYLYSSSSETDTITCYNPNAELQWQLPLLPSNSTGQIVGFNEHKEILIIYGTGQNLQGSLYDENGLPIWINKILSTSYKTLLPSINLTWIDNKWIFKMGQLGSAVFCLDRYGTMLWGEDGVNNFDRILSAVPVDKESIFVVYQKLINTFERDLYLQKMNMSGEYLWNDQGVKISENIGSNCNILPDKMGGAYIIYDCNQISEPEIRLRGVYFQKADKDGNLGVITSIKLKENIENTQVKTSVFCYPNPTRGTTTFKIISQVGEKLKGMIIYDLLGREITEFNLGYSTNEIILKWNGKNRNGVNVTPGIYYYIIKSNKNTNYGGKFVRIN